MNDSIRNSEESPSLSSEISRVIAVIFVWFGFRRLYPSGSNDNLEGLAFDVKPARTCVLFTLGLLNDKLYNHFSGRHVLKCDAEICLPNERIHAADIDFVFLCPMAAFDNIAPHVLHRFLFGQRLSEKLDRWEILFRYATHCESTIIMDGFLRGLDANEVDEVVLYLKDSKIPALVITDDFFMADSVLDNLDNLYYYKGESRAVQIVDAHKMKNTVEFNMDMPELTQYTDGDQYSPMYHDIDAGLEAEDVDKSDDGKK